TERQHLITEVTESTQRELQRLLARAALIAQENHLDSRVSFLQALEERIATLAQQNSGSYVYAGFYRADGSQSVERQDSGHRYAKAVEHYIRTRPPASPHDDGSAETVLLGGKLHVHVILPIPGPGQEKIGSVQALFAPSENVIEGIQNKLRRTLLLIVLTVLATSALLYPVLVHLVNRLTTFSRDLLQANLDTLALLANVIAKRDRSTGNHHFRVTLYAVRLAESMGLADAEIQTLIKGAFLHDIGKIGVCDELLLKSGKLSREERSLMQDHVRHGMDIIAGSGWLADAEQIIENHHEKFDGSGYPQGKAGEEIPLSARIFAVADVFDALTSERPYKKPFSLKEASTVLERGRNTHFDPQVLSAFQTLIPELYRTYVEGPPEKLRDDLQKVFNRYFSEKMTVYY
ncbi:MAG: HD domain-containing protein, partial [Desulfobulbus sp.]|nr:HD domain-containing protein [Desulfobulbus sp.]